MPREKPQLRPRLVFSNGAGAAFGPGKAEVLGRIAATGSIRSAAAEMGMSYSRAWILVREMNGLFRTPLVSATRGGGTGGGAALTALGVKVLDRYGRMERSCAAATRTDWSALRRLLASGE